MKKEIKINGRKIGNNHPPYIIAEMSANHNGSIDRALETIKKASECGVDAIKMQTYTADTMTIDCSNEEFLIKGGLWDGYKLYDLYKWAETPFEWHERLFSYAKKLGVTLFSTPFDENGVDLLEELNTPAYKVASFELVDIPLIKYIASKQKPVIFSTGMSTEEEINDAVNAMLEVNNHQLIILHCISSYPAPPEKSNLNQIKNISNKFGVISGLSDHTLGTTISVAATALGASVIEKHFTLDRSEKGPDSEFSIEPKELIKLCKSTKRAWLALGKEGFNRDTIESQSMSFRRSIYFVKNKKAGEIITKDDIRRIRPSKGLSPKFEGDIIGRILKKDVKRGEPTSWDKFIN
tara:strand:- start:907 stop:1959 length:1053 start_codon:yes stop_codon:yes gene_type:complete